HCSCSGSWAKDLRKMGTATVTGQFYSPVTVLQQVSRTKAAGQEMARWEGKGWSWRAKRTTRLPWGVRVGVAGASGATRGDAGQAIGGDEVTGVDRAGHQGDGRGQGQEGHERSFRSPRLSDFQL